MAGPGAPGLFHIHPSLTHHPVSDRSLRSLELWMPRGWDLLGPACRVCLTAVLQEPTMYDPVPGPPPHCPCAAGEGLTPLQVGCPPHFYSLSEQSDSVRT